VFIVKAHEGYFKSFTQYCDTLELATVAADGIARASKLPAHILNEDTGVKYEVVAGQPAKIVAPR
jgi:hypothetical protein